jgi:hypothetical protein
VVLKKKLRKDWTVCVNWTNRLRNNHREIEREPR